MFYFQVHFSRLFELLSTLWLFSSKDVGNKEKTTNMKHYSIFVLILLVLNYTAAYMGVVGISVLSFEIISDEEVSITKESLGTLLFVSALFKMAGKVVNATLVDSINPKALLILSVLLRNFGIIMFLLSFDFYKLLIWWTFQEVMW